MVLNVIGPDDSSGKLTFNNETNTVLFKPPHDHLLPQKIKSMHRIAKKLGGILFMSRYRSTSVHLLGGCVASEDVSNGVCNPKGQVFDATSATGVHSGLYICDASIIPCSVGVNPCLTITAAAEHVSRHIVKDNIKFIRNLENGFSGKKGGGVMEDFKMKEGSDWEAKTIEPMKGKIGGMQCRSYLIMRFKPSHHLRAKVGGYIECRGLETGKMYVIEGEVDVCKTDVRTPYTQYMHYHLLLSAPSGSRLEVFEVVVLFELKIDSGLF